MKERNFQAAAATTRLTPEEAKKAAFERYEAGDPDAALELLYGVPRDAEVCSLLFQMRCDDQAKSIVVLEKK